MNPNGIPLSIDDFQIIGKIGQGSFSEVVHAIHKPTGMKFALKQLYWNNAPDKILNEVKAMILLNTAAQKYLEKDSQSNQFDNQAIAVSTNLHENTNSDINLVKLFGIFRDFDQTTLIMNYIPHTPFRSFLTEITSTMIRDYMKSLFTALSFVHSQKIIHRDVKPANFLFDPNSGNGCLIDFGLCQTDLHLNSYQEAPEIDNIHKPIYIHKDSIKISNKFNDDELIHPEKYQNRPKMIANRAGTRGFRAPEVLLAAFNQTPKLDVWSSGVILLSMLTQRYPFFRSRDDLEALAEIATIIGSKRLCEAARECGRVVVFEGGPINGIDLKQMCYELNPNLTNIDIDLSVFDLLEKLLEPSPSQRLSCSEALQHRFFSC